MVIIRYKTVYTLCNFAFNNLAPHNINYAIYIVYCDCCTPKTDIIDRKELTLFAE